MVYEDNKSCKRQNIKIHNILIFYLEFFLVLNYNFFFRIY